MAKKPTIVVTAKEAPMRIDYSTDAQGWLWACLHRSDGRFTHYFLGRRSLDERKSVMYRLMIKGGAQ